MATRDSQVGIKQLFEAEEKAKEIVAKARREKNQLLKQARDEAEKEISDYKGKRTKEFTEFSQKHLAGTEGYTKQLASTTTEQIAKLATEEKQGGEKVIQMLLKYVNEVNTEVEAEF